MTGGRAGPRSESLSLSLLALGFEGGSGGEVGLSSRGAGGRDGPKIFRRFGEDEDKGGESGLLFCEGVSSELKLDGGFGAVANADSSSSCCARFRLARRCGGREGPMAAMTNGHVCNDAPTTLLIPTYLLAVDNAARRLARLRRCQDFIRFAKASFRFKPSQINFVSS